MRCLRTARRAGVPSHIMQRRYPALCRHRSTLNSQCHAQSIPSQRSARPDGLPSNFASVPFALGTPLATLQCTNVALYLGYGRSVPLRRCTCLLLGVVTHDSVTAAGGQLRLVVADALVRAVPAPSRRRDKTSRARRRKRARTSMSPGIRASLAPASRHSTDRTRPRYAAPSLLAAAAARRPRGSHGCVSRRLSIGGGGPRQIRDTRYIVIAPSIIARRHRVPGRWRLRILCSQASVSTYFRTGWMELGMVR